MKIQLLSPPCLYEHAKVSGGVNPPMGLMYLSSFLKKHGHSVTILDCTIEAPDQINETHGFLYRGLSFDGIASRVDRDTDLIGIASLFSCAFPLVSRLSDTLKARHALPIVVGGAHASALPHYVLENKNIDFVVISEGETALLELCDYLAGTKDLREIDGIGYRTAKDIVIQQKRNYIANLDDLPFPDRDYTDIKKYSDLGEGWGPSRFSWTPLITSRGCPFKCTYCTAAVWDNNWRARSAKNVVDEIEQCVRNYGVKEFLIEDENFTFRKERVVQICDEIVARGLDIRWQTTNGIRASVTDEEMLRRMKRSGCHTIVLAPESGSERVLREIMNKPQDIERIVSLAKYAKRIGLFVMAYFMLGMPGEKKEEVRLTMKLANRLARIGVDEITMSPFSPLPGSSLFNKLLGEGRVRLDDELLLSLYSTGDVSRAKSWSEYMSDKEVTRFKLKTLMGFHFRKALYHPLKVLKSLYNIVLGEQEIRTERAIRSYIKRYLI